MELQGSYECNDAIIGLRAHGIPAYLTAEQAVNSIVALRKYAVNLRKEVRRQLTGQSDFFWTYSW